MGRVYRLRPHRQARVRHITSFLAAMPCTQAGRCRHGDTARRRRSSPRGVGHRAASDPSWAHRPAGSAIAATVTAGCGSSSLSTAPADARRPRLRAAGAPGGDHADVGRGARRRGGDRLSDRPGRRRAAHGRGREPLLRGRRHQPGSVHTYTVRAADRAGRQKSRDSKTVTATVPSRRPQPVPAPRRDRWGDPPGWKQVFADDFDANVPARRLPVGGVVDVGRPIPTARRTRARTGPTTRQRSSASTTA
jgi:hypothetical protein